MRRLAGAAVALLACTFAPDLSRFPPCGQGDSCPPGSSCLAAEQRCVRDCPGEGDCPAEDGGADAGPAVVLAAAPLDAGVESRPYSHQLAAQGGTPPYWFSATQALPAGFSVTDGGLLSTADAGAAGLLDLPLEVRDDAGARDARTLMLRIRPLLRVAGPATLARAFQNEAYFETLSATGGTPEPPQGQAYAFALDGGSVLGLQLNAQGELSGTPTQLGTFQLGGVVTDGQGQMAARQVQLTVDLGATFLGISTESLPDARAGWPYRYQLQRHGGGASVTWSITGGTLPAGIGLDPSTGVISGTTTLSGLFNVTVRVTDGALFDHSTSFTLNVESN